MQVLSVASEIYPLIKTGGLADVAGALPPVLKGMGIEVRSLVPGYPGVMSRASGGQTVHEFANLLGEQARLISVRVGELDLYVLDCPALFARPGGPYNDATGKDHSDNWKRFAAFSMAGAILASGVLEGFNPDLVHVHDWQAALVPAYMRYRGIHRPSVITIHNLAFQGQFGPDVFSGLELPPHAYAIDGVEYYGGVGYLKAGLACASALTTVSPTYAKEISREPAGMGLAGLISGRADALHGIVNGIDIDVWDPATDPHLAAPYSREEMGQREVNRRQIEARFGLDADDAPLFVIISRLTWQKGLDLVAASVPRFVSAGAKLAILGTGEASLESWLLGLSGEHEGRIGVQLSYDETLAHIMQGGADAILIPSRFEPCGLTQLYAQRYGTIPVVARTGGLADTVIEANTAALTAGVATGVLFEPGSADALVDAVQRIVEIKAQPQLWTAMQRQGMKLDVS